MTFKTPEKKTADVELKLWNINTRKFLKNKKWK